MHKFLIALSLCFFSMLGTSQKMEMVENALADFNFDSLLTEVKILTGEIPVSIGGQQEIIYSRMAEKEGNELAFQYMKERLQYFGLKTESQTFTVQGKNLFGIKYGTTYPGRICIIGAHYDNFPLTTIAPGADDNASGCAAVLEAARVLSKYDFPNTLMFALWDEEELGLLGSTAFCKGTKMHPDSLFGYINLDMIGWDGNNDNKSEVHVKSTANSYNLLQTVINCNSLYDIGLNLEIIDPASGNTDHAPFWTFGYTAVGISEEYVGDFNPNWHKVSDSLTYFDANFYASNSRLAIATLTTIALSKGDNTQTFLGDAIVFPNPSSVSFTVQLGQLLTPPVQIDITDTMGRVVFSNQYHEKNELINIDGISQLRGFFTVEIKSEEYSKSIPLVLH